MIFLEPLPGETLASVLARQTRVNGYADGCDFLSTLLGGHQVTSLVNAEIDVPLFCESVGNAYGTAKSMIRNLTHLHAQSQLGDLTMLALREVECGNRILTLGKLTFIDTMVLSYCHACVANDRAQYGFSYWHRVHQIPLIQSCPVHGDGLMRFAGKHARLHQYFPLPGDELVQSNARKVTSGSQNIWPALASMGEKILLDQTEPANPDVIRDLFQEELRLRSLVTATGRLRSDDFEKAFRQLFPFSSVDLIEPIRVLFENPKQLLRGVIDGNESRPFARMVLIHWFFGDWTIFKERCNWIEIFGKPLERELDLRDFGEVLQATVSTNETAIRRNHRQTCMDYMTENANSSRREFLKTNYRSFRWLRHRDQSWLNTQLPVPSRQVVQFDLFDQQTSSVAAITATECERHEGAE